jgi:Carbohydrate esterase, sialic acid-specific acetylesterase
MVKMKKALVEFINRIRFPMDPRQITCTDGRERQQVPIHLLACKDPMVIMTFGQSTCTNEGDLRGLYVPTEKVFNFNFLDGKCYVAKDPLLGTTRYRANWATRLGDMIIQQGYANVVILVPIAYSGTFIADWAPGGIMQRRLLHAVRQVHATGLRMSMALWQQGEAEAQISPDGEAYFRQFIAMVKWLRADAKMFAPIYVAQCTRSHMGCMETIREAQRRVVNTDLGIYSGPDIDAIGPEHRIDNVHFTKSGLELCAAYWCSAIIQRIECS